MRLPFDLIAAVMLLEAVRHYLTKQLPTTNRSHFLFLTKQHVSVFETMVALAGFWLLVWLLHEALVRMVEWRIRWGRIPIGSGSDGRRRSHPFEFHARGVLGIQVLTVLGFGALVWFYQWPIRTCEWPEWLGLSKWVSVEVRDSLAKSSVMGGILDLAPFLVAMLIGWMPKHRLAQSVTRNRVSLFSYLSMEAKLTLLPCILWVAICLFDDFNNFALGGALTKYMQGSWGMVINLLILAILATVVVPLAVVLLWRCRPFPQGELRTRLDQLLERSGVRVRAILLWGPMGSSLANACVLGPWSGLRFILISPGLIDVLTPDECEAVLAHEIGHARHGHLRVMFAFVGCLALSCWLLAMAFPLQNKFAEAGLFLAVNIVFIRFFFGIISRACEKEADLSSAELMGTAVPLIGALERLAEMSGNIREVYSWHHDSIAKRVSWLVGIGENQSARDAYHSKMSRFRKIVFTLVLVLAIACAVF